MLDQLRRTSPFEIRRIRDSRPLAEAPPEMLALCAAMKAALAAMPPFRGKRDRWVSQWITRENGDVHHTAFAPWGELVAVSDHHVLGWIITSPIRRVGDKWMASATARQEIEVTL